MERAGEHFKQNADRQILRKILQNHPGMLQLELLLASCSIFHSFIGSASGSVNQAIGHRYHSLACAFGSASFAPRVNATFSLTRKSSRWPVKNAWPGEADDGFETLIRNLRQDNVVGELRS